MNEEKKKRRETKRIAGLEKENGKTIEKEF